MEKSNFGISASVAVAGCAVVFLLVCLFRRSKKQTTGLNVSSSATELSEVTIDDLRKGFTFDDPYQNIDLSDEVKTLSSDNSHSADSALGTASPGHSGHSGHGFMHVIATNRRDSGSRRGSSPASSVPGPDSQDPAPGAADEPVYEVIAFQRDGSVNHHPDTAPTDLHHDHDDNSDDETYHTYEDVDQGGEEVDEGVEGKVNAAFTGNGDEGIEEGEDGVFEEPEYSSVYESVYVDCASQGREGSQVDQLSLGRNDSDMVSLPKHTTAACGSNTPCSSGPNQHPAAAGETTSSTWAAIKARVKEMKKLKQTSSAARAPDSHEGNTSPPASSVSSAQDVSRDVVSSPPCPVKDSGRVPHGKSSSSSPPSLTSTTQGNGAVRESEPPSTPRQPTAASAPPWKQQGDPRAGGITTTLPPQPPSSATSLASQAQLSSRPFSYLSGLAAPWRPRRMSESGAVGQCRQGSEDSGQGDEDCVTPRDTPRSARVDRSMSMLLPRKPPVPPKPSRKQSMPC